MSKEYVYLWRCDVHDCYETLYTDTDPFISHEQMMYAKWLYNKNLGIAYCPKHRAVLLGE